MAEHSELFETLLNLQRAVNEEHEKLTPEERALVARENLRQMEGQSYLFEQERCGASIDFGGATVQCNEIDGHDEMHRLIYDDGSYYYEIAWRPARG